MHIPTRFCHVHKTKFTHANKLFPHTSWTYSSKPTINFSQCQYSQNLNQNSYNKITIYPHCQKFHELPILSKLHHDKKKIKKNTPRMLQNQLITQCPQIVTTKWQYLTMKLSMEHETIFFQAKKPKKKKKKKNLTLVSTWQYGAWVLESWISPLIGRKLNDPLW